MLLPLSLLYLSIISAVSCKNSLPHSSTPPDSTRWNSMSSPPAPKPNILLILTDDQDTDLGSLQFMPKLAKYLGDEGATYKHGYVGTPMCCPSRSSLLTGLYVHNHHVYTNNDNCSSSYWVENHEKKTFATYLQASGYRTAYYGKYLNKYTGHHIPPGWDEWQGLVKNSRFYNYTINSDGEMKHHGDNYADDYLPDLITNKTLQMISDNARSSSPFLAVLSYPGPHGPEDAAPQYQDMFHNVTSHHTPAYDFAPNPDKQWILRHTEKMLPIHRSFTDMLMTKRLQTLQSVDSAVEKIVHRLAHTGQLDNTYIFYTSDHGYHLGQFGLVKGKAFPFDFDTHVPFIVRGPGIAPGSVRTQPVLNIDLAPTFLSIAGLSKPRHMDGRSLLPTFKNPGKKMRDAFLIERGKMTFERYSLVSQDKKNVLGQKYSSDEKKDHISLHERLLVECKKTRYQAPCGLGQKWVCKTRGDGSVKIGRCKNRRRNPSKTTICHCNPGEVFGWKYSDLEQKERKKSSQRSLKMKKMFPRQRMLNRIRISRSSDHEEMFDEISHEEAEEVDILVENIDDEIRELHSITNSTECASATNDVACTPMIEENPSTWVTSRNTIKHQIQQLRAQLNELKQIRKYLKLKIPVTKVQEVKRHMKSGSSSIIGDSEAEVCFCDAEKNKKARTQHQKQEREEKRRERKFERLLRKERKRKIVKRKERISKKQDHCVSDVKMNCFSHDNNHWKTAPLWSEGPFCACTNSNNNTYWCARNINSTHNYLYCEYVTGMMTYFDLRVDPFQLRNLLYTLTDTDLNYMHRQVTQLKSYSGNKRFLARQLRKQRMQKLKLRRNQGRMTSKFAREGLSLYS